MDKWLRARCSCSIVDTTGELNKAQLFFFRFGHFLGVFVSFCFGRFFLNPWNRGKLRLFLGRPFF